MGNTAAEWTVWVSDTSVLLKLARGYAHSRSLTLTAGIRVGTLSEAASYDIPSVSSVALEQLFPPDDNRVFVSGTSFARNDYSPTVRVGGSATESTVWASDSSLKLKVAQGVGRTHTIAVTGSLNIATLTEAFSYFPPSIQFVIPGNLPPRSLADTPFVSVIRANFATTSYSPTARFGHTRAESTIWESDTSISANIPSGASRTLTVAVTAGLQIGSTTESWSYNIPTLRVANTFTNSLTSGQVSTTISGANFAINSVSLRMREGGTACEATDWVSETSVMSKYAQGVSMTHTVAITAAIVVGSLTEAVSYDAPSVSSIAVTNMVTVATQTLTMSGANFGRVSYTPWETALVRAVTGCRTRL